MPAVFDHWNTATSPPLHAVILAHPDADSFNAAVAQAYCEAVRGPGHEAVLRDLYRLGFDPVLNIGQLCRVSYGSDAMLIGFGTDTCTVAAASDWGADMHIETVRPTNRQAFAHASRWFYTWFAKA